MPPLSNGGIISNSIESLVIFTILGGGHLAGTIKYYYIILSAAVIVVRDGWLYSANPNIFSAATRNWYGKPGLRFLIFIQHISPFVLFIFSLRSFNFNSSFSSSISAFISFTFLFGNNNALKFNCLKSNFDVFFYI